MNKYFTFDDDVFDREYLVCRLEEKVNDGLLSHANHIQDNGFFEDTLNGVVREMKKRKYEPIGISLNPPFECTVASNSIAFVMRIDEEIYWVHMPETYWFHLLADYCGREHADIIISELKNSYKPKTVEIKLEKEEFDKLLQVKQLDRVIFCDDNFRCFTVYNLVADDDK